MHPRARRRVELPQPARRPRPAGKALSRPRADRHRATRHHRYFAAAFPSTSRCGRGRGAAAGNLPAGSGVVACQCPVRGSAMKPLPLSDNPCRPRHFKPAPCAPVSTEGAAQQSLETSHTRLIITGALFCLAFLVIGARLVEVAGLKSGGPRPPRTPGAERGETSPAHLVYPNRLPLPPPPRPPPPFPHPHPRPRP